VGSEKCLTILKKLIDEVSHTATCERESCSEFIPKYKSENRIGFGPSVQELRGFLYDPASKNLELLN